MLTQFISALLLPPGLPLWLALLGLALLRWRPNAARAVLLLALMALYSLSTPLLAGLLADAAQPHPPLSDVALNAADADAIVLLAGGLYRDAPEYHGDSVGLLSLGRARYAARLAHRSGLPILVSGGVRNDNHDNHGSRPSEAELLAQLLRNEFGVSRVISENRSLTTAGNARFSAQRLSAAGWQRVLLVTHAVHMSRALAAFRRSADGALTVIAAPTLFLPSRPSLSDAYSWQPSAAALWRSRYVLYELLGQIWYRYGWRD